MIRWILSCAVIAVVHSHHTAVHHAMQEHGVVPDVIDTAPENEIQITYSSAGVSAMQGNELTPTQVKDLPTISYAAENNSLYTLLLVDPDAPSRQNPVMGPFLHYIVGNIPGNDVSKGETLFPYVGSGPPKGTGLHRYVWLLYKQPGTIDFSKEKNIDATTIESRRKFSIKSFTEGYNLGKPIAGNFYQAQYDDYVPILHAQLNRNH